MNVPALKGRGYTERPNVIQAAALQANGLTTFTQQYPLSEGWHAMYLRFSHLLTHGTGTTPIAEGELLIIKNVLLRTDKGEVVCNLPGRALYKIATYRQCSAPRKDAVAAATATYRVTLPIYFSDDMLQRPEDSILNTARYNTVTLQITYGGIADLLAVVGTDTNAGSLDVDLERTLGVLPPQALPAFHASYDFDPPVDASVQQFVNLERAADMSIKRLFVHSSTGGTGGVAWSGVNADTIQNIINLKNQNRFIEQNRIHAMIQDVNKLDQFLEAIISGVEVFDFVRDRSITSALATGGLAVLQYAWVNQAGVAANSIVTTARDMIRTLKA
jgi:hypothetical protein